MDLPDVSEPIPLEPTLMTLIVEVYEGTRDEAGRYHTVNGVPGYAKYVGGCSYRGGFADGVMHGQGKYKWSDGTTYEGELKWNTIDGRGSFTWPDGSSYSGDLRLGLRHGNGSFAGPEGAPSYKGSWCKGKRHGEGTLWYDADNDCSYEGEWFENRRHGQGRMRFKPNSRQLNRSAVLTAGSPRAARLKHSSSLVGGSKEAREGNLYEGSWVHDQKCGLGTMNWYDKRERFSGEWVSDQQHGKGEHVWMEDRPDSNTPGVPKQMCNRYIGDWVQGERHGQGTFFFANGARYDGSWVHDTKQGYGVFTFEDGHVYEGPFDEDRMVEEDRESPLHGKDPTQQPQLRLHIEDLVDVHSHTSGEEPLASRMALEKTILRYNSELRRMYRFYATQEHGSLPEEGGVFSLSIGQFKKLWQDCALGSYGVSLATVHRLASRMRVMHQGKVQVLTLARKHGLPVPNPATAATAATAAGSSSNHSHGHGALPDASNVLGGKPPPPGLAKMTPLFKAPGAGTSSSLSSSSSSSGSASSSSSSSGGAVAAAVAVVTNASPDDEGGTYRWNAQPLLFREFAELLARIACVAFCSPDDCLNQALKPNNGQLQGSRPGTSASSNNGGSGGGSGTARSSISGVGGAVGLLAGGGGQQQQQQLSARSSATSATGFSTHMGGGVGAMSRQGSLSSAVMSTASGASGGAGGGGGGGSGATLGGAHPLLGLPGGAASAAAPVPTKAPSPSEAFTLLMKLAVQGFHSKPLVKGTFEWCVSVDEDTKLVLASHSSRLQAAFKRYATKPPLLRNNKGTTAAAANNGAGAGSGSGSGSSGSVGGGGGGGGGHRITLRSLLKLLAAAGAEISRERGGLGLSADDVLGVLVAGQDSHPLVGDPTLLESELLWGEFIEALAHVAESAKPADLPPMETNAMAMDSSSPSSMGGNGGLGGVGGLDDDLAYGEADDKVALSTGWPGAMKHGQQPLHKHLEALLVKLDLEAATWAQSDDNDQKEEEEEEDNAQQLQQQQQLQQLRMTGPEIDDEGSVGESSIGSLRGDNALGGVGGVGGVGPFGTPRHEVGAPVPRAPRLPIVL